jgi:hypothetical protein
MERGGARHHHEQADHAGEHRSQHHADALVTQILHGHPLVGRIRLDEGEPPRRKRGAHRGHGHQHGVACERHARHEQAVRRRAPVRMSKEAGDDVGGEHGAEHQQDVLDAVEGAAQHQDARGQRGHRHAHVAAHPAEQFHARRDPRELGAGGAEVGHQQRGQGEGGGARPVTLAHEPQHPLAGYHPHPRTQLVEDDQRGRGHRQHPEHLVAVLGAKDRVRRNAGGVVVGQAREQPGPHHSHEKRERAPAHGVTPWTGEPHAQAASHVCRRRVSWRRHRARHRFRRARPSSG